MLRRPARILPQSLPITISRVFLIGRDIGVRKIGTDFVEFQSGQRIWFDGKYHLTTLWQG
jgi:hypothetical protein